MKFDEFVYHPRTPEIHISDRPVYEELMPHWQGLARGRLLLEREADEATCARHPTGNGDQRPLDSSRSGRNGVYLLLPHLPAVFAHVLYLAWDVVFSCAEDPGSWLDSIAALREMPRSSPWAIGATPNSPRGAKILPAIYAIAIWT